MTDDQTFGFRAQSQPELADASAHVAGGAYNASAVAAVVEMAHTRGIAVLPELEMPGHARSWRHSHPEMINDPCPPAEAGCKFANVNPANPRMWTVLANVIADVAAAFPGAPVHFGGDETNFAAWNSPSLQAWAQEQARLGATAPSRTFAKLDTPHQVWTPPHTLAHFPPRLCSRYACPRLPTQVLEQFETTLQRVVARTLGPRPVVRWEEAMKANLVECCLPPDRTVIQFWRMPRACRRVRAYARVWLCVSGWGHDTSFCPSYLQSMCSSPAAPCWTPCAAGTARWSPASSSGTWIP